MGNSEDLDPVDPSNTTDTTGSEISEPVLIASLAAGGDGVARTSDGRVIFVEGAVPGDRVELTEIRAKKRLIRAKIGGLLSPSPDRVEPRCPHFETCGGCAWQHVAYSAQLEAKRTIVHDALERIGGLNPVPAFEITPSPDPYGYRARARWVESAAGLGYRMRGSNRITHVGACPVLVASAEKKLVDRAQALEAARVDAPDPTGKPKRGKEWVVTAGSQTEAILRPAKSGSAGRNREEPPGSVMIKVSGESLRVSSASFVQGNALLWDAFSSAVRDECLWSPAEGASLRFVELYAGIGFFTLPLARLGATGVVLESDRSALADMKFNLRRSGFEEKIEVVAGRVETRRDLSIRFRSADLLLVDPPRIGLDERVREAIAADGPSRVVYVSCDPATLARDLKVLTAGGYEIASLSAFDLFPQTPHVECVVRLERG